MGNKLRTTALYVTAKLNVQFYAVEKPNYEREFVGLSYTLVLDITVEKKNCCQNLNTKLSTKKVSNLTPKKRTKAWS